jgi:hypothetical protein
MRKKVKEFDRFAAGFFKDSNTKLFNTGLSFFQ